MVKRITTAVKTSGSTTVGGSAATTVHHETTKENATSGGSSSPSSGGVREKLRKRERSTDPTPAAVNRPKRRAASAVRFGSYREMEHVDFSLLDHFQFDDSSSTPASKSSSGSTKKSLSSKQPAARTLKRSKLMTSTTSTANKIVASTTTLNTPTKSKTRILDIPKEALLLRKKGGSKMTSGVALQNLLPPVLITRLENGIHDIAPSILRHLSSLDCEKVDIFNRKTGKIMKGEDGIIVKDLTSALLDHAEYEPIIPGYSVGKNDGEEGRYRQARSSATARISETVQPQSMLRESKVKGKTVLITGGAYKGLFGKVDSRIPGEWYVLSGVLRDGGAAGLDVVVHSKHLKVVTCSSIQQLKRSPATPRDNISEKNVCIGNDKINQDEDRVESGEFYAAPVSKKIDSLQLRIEALEEQKSKLLIEEADTLSSSFGNSDKNEEEDMEVICLDDEDEVRASQIVAEMRRIKQNIMEAKSELQRCKLVRNVLVGRGLDGQSRKLADDHMDRKPDSR